MMTFKKRSKSTRLAELVSFKLESILNSNRVVYTVIKTEDKHKMCRWQGTNCLQRRRVSVGRRRNMSLCHGTICYALLPWDTPPSAHWKEYNSEEWSQHWGRNPNLVPVVGGSGGLFCQSLKALSEKVKLMECRKNTAVIVLHDCMYRRIAHIQDNRFRFFLCIQAAVDWRNNYCKLAPKCVENWAS